MKKLQNNFTTPEQSKRLLGLGVPADSADMILIREKSGDMQFYDYTFEKLALNYDEKYSDWDTLEWKLTHDILPCWSVGRLIEIFAKCKMYSYEDRTNSLQLYADEINGGLVEFLIDVLYKYNDLDFSKLEE